MDTASLRIRNKAKAMIEVEITHPEYLTLVQRYKELLSSGGGTGGDDIPFEIDTHITEIDTGKIDADYMNTRFVKYLKALQSCSDTYALEKTLSELQHSFASLSQDDQKIAAIFLRDIQRGAVQVDPAHSFRDYLTEYHAKAQHEEVDKLVEILGIDPAKLMDLMNTSLTDATINEYGRFDELKATIDKAKAKAYFEALEGSALPPFKVNMKAAQLLRDFIIQGGFELQAD